MDIRDNELYRQLCAVLRKAPRGDCPFDASMPRLTVLFTPFSTDHHPKIIMSLGSLLPLPAENLTAEHASAITPTYLPT